MTKLHRFIPALLALLIVGCATVGVFPRDDFSDQVAAGYATIAAAHDMSATLLDGRVIGSKDSANIDRQLETAREGIDIARTLSGQDATNRLTVALAALNAAKSYLCEKQPPNPNCITR